MKTLKLKKLTPEEKRVIVGKGTEIPFSGEYDSNFKDGVYTCRRCGAMLYKSSDKFDAKCGWPSFDDAITGAVKRVPDRDGVRTEIICANCNAHLGHVFEGERLTKKNTRYCVNSISMKFVPKSEVKTERAIFAGGCFWGVEYHLKKMHGVISTTVGYIGGHKANPTYEKVCSGKTGHVEGVEVVYDPIILSYEDVAKMFFEIHDPEQTNGQGPDIGEQYLSYVFYVNDSQKKTAEKLIQILTKKGYKIATKLKHTGKFWKAENYHQDYYTKKKSLPYCHIYTKRFD
jgi:peptide methionine sulfoxide reductase msrA/msrB